ncbi:hypothetical protein QBC33DRAFT_544943 [Phialemonium atrogriseum]|uniref:Methyltransferase type 12 domain-containing protein n=1 Tax=Phialemonium atrogriseum TaxID=1093897 RepID=A0AAJ0FLL5_9PEZI|nr:uncharacterized protein QBC33DRAFT_544943 [Phialemonium atrogriseum]KAK1765225.1 hypothetical protein QBC33DRAFT_544943 [Phialemonium atrogriseum]
MADPESKPAPNDGSRRFTPSVLFIYDLLVIYFSNPLVWHCPTGKHLLPLFKENFSTRHLDIGVGNGYFPIAALTANKKSNGGKPPAGQHLTLVDLSPHSLDAAKQRILSRHPGAVDIRTVLADAAQPIAAAALGGEEGRPSFDSASLYLVLHCMPGPTAQKARAFGVARQHLSAEGVLIGSTVLGKVWERGEDGRYRVKTDKVGWLTGFALRFYNKRGIMDNYEEDPQVLEDVLKKEFEEVETRIVGMMLLFKAKRPRVGLDNGIKVDE